MMSPGSSRSNRYRRMKNVDENCDGEINDMLRIRLREAGSDEEIFTLDDWVMNKVQKNDLELLSMFDASTQNVFAIGARDDCKMDEEERRWNSEITHQHETVEEVLLPQVHHEFLLWEGCNKDAKSRMGCDGEIDDILRIRLQLCHEFYSTYEFDKVCADDELKTKKIVKFRLGGRAYSLTLLEFTRRLGLYQSVELEEEGFNVYFKGGLRSDEHFNAQDYWLSISREENLSLSRSHTSTINKPILRVIHKMITYGLCWRTTGYDKVQKNDFWLFSMFDARHQNGVLTEDVVKSLSASIYCRDLDTTTLRDLVDSDGKLILEDPQPGVPRGAYNSPGYAQPQYDQYYQQYPPPPPKYQQQHDDDE
ncbi:hypothetical protein Tco_0054509 [Tanacetum coccineum]